MTDSHHPTADASELHAAEAIVREHERSMREPTGEHLTDAERVAAELAYLRARALLAEYQTGQLPLPVLR